MAFSAAQRSRGAAAIDAVERLTTRESSAQQVAEEVLERVAGVIDADAFFLAATDPDTGLGIGATIAHNFPEEACWLYWDHELRVADYNKFADLTQAHPVGDLRRATGGTLDRSPRYRMMSEVAELGDELRMRPWVGGRPWGNVQLSRRLGEMPFTEVDRDFLCAIAPVAGAALRATLRRHGAAGVDPRHGPGVLVLDEAGTLLGATPEGTAWLTQLADGYREYPARDRPSAYVPAELLLLCQDAHSAPDAPARRTRLCTTDGIWLVAHCSKMSASDQMVIVLEPAGAAQIAPIVIQAYGLSNREVEIARLAASGLQTREIARRLFLSPYTVRDHLKAAYDKVGVSSRAELTAQLFADPYRDALRDPSSDG